MRPWAPKTILILSALLSVSAFAQSEVVAIQPDSGYSPAPNLTTPTSDLTPVEPSGQSTAQPSEQPVQVSELRPPTTPNPGEPTSNAGNTDAIWNPQIEGAVSTCSNLLSTAKNKCIPGASSDQAGGEMSSSKDGVGDTPANGTVQVWTHIESRSRHMAHACTSAIVSCHFTCEAQFKDYAQKCPNCQALNRLSSVIRNCVALTEYQQKLVKQAADSRTNRDQAQATDQSSRERPKEDDSRSPPSPVPQSTATGERQSEDLGLSTAMGAAIPAAAAYQGVGGNVGGGAGAGGGGGSPARTVAKTDLGSAVPRVPNPEAEPNSKDENASLSPEAQAKSDANPKGSALLERRKELLKMLEGQASNGSMAPMALARSLGQTESVGSKASGSQGGDSTQNRQTDRAQLQPPAQGTIGFRAHNLATANARLSKNLSASYTGGVSPPSQSARLGSRGGSNSFSSGSGSGSGFTSASFANGESGTFSPGGRTVKLDPRKPYDATPQTDATRLNQRPFGVADAGGSAGGTKNARKTQVRLPAPINLAEYLPNGRRYQGGRGPAGLNVEENGIHRPATDIWTLITNRFHAHCLEGRLRDCRLQRGER